MNALPPAHEVQQAVCVAVEALVCKAADIVAVQVAIDPADTPAGQLLDHLIRAVRARWSFLTDHAELHGCAASRERLELMRVAALNEEGVGIVALWQHGRGEQRYLERQGDGPTAPRPADRSGWHRHRR